METSHRHSERSSGERSASAKRRPEWLENCEHEVTPFGRAYCFGGPVTAFLDALFCRSKRKDTSPEEPL